MSTADGRIVWVMKVLITGAGGFLGSRLANTLLSDDSVLKPTALVLTDVVQPPKPIIKHSIPVTAIKSDITVRAEIEQLVTPDIDVIFALHGIMSGGSETDFELGMKVNFEATHALLQIIRRTKPSIVLVFTSSMAVFGGDNLPHVIEDTTILTPQSSYGTEKAMCELLITDYSRRGFLDGRALRLPTITVRAGKPNSAASSYVSGIIREPLHGLPSNCPVPMDFPMWVSSPRAVLRNIMLAATIPAEKWGMSRAVTVPGLQVTSKEMMQALEKVAGKKALDLVTQKEEPAVWAIAGGWPGVHNPVKGLALGMTSNASFEENIREYIEDENLQQYM